MKPSLFALIVLSGSLAAARGAIVQAFWSAQTEQDAVANGGSFDPDVTASTFPTAVSVSLAGVHVLNGGSMQGGSPAFTDFQGNSWNGVAGATGAGFAFGWNGTSTSGPDSLSISFDLTNLRNLSIQMQVRSAQGGSAPRPAAFSAVEYSIAGGTFVPVPGADLGNFTSNSYVNMSFNLAAIDAIEGQPDVQVRFTVADTSSTTSFRFDNIQVIADTVPEPALCTTLAMSAGLVLRRRRRD